MTDDILIKQISLRDSFAQMLHKSMNDDKKDQTTNIYTENLNIYSGIKIEILDDDETIYENIKLLMKIIEEESNKKNKKKNHR